METVDTTIANVGSRVALRAAVVSASAKAQVKILVITFTIIAIEIAVMAEVVKTVATPLSVAVAIPAAIMTWVFSTLILYANTMTLTTRDRIAVISMPIMVIPVSLRTSLFVTMTVELTLKSNTQQAEVTEAVADIRTAAERMAEMEVRRVRRQRMLNNMFHMGAHQAMLRLEEDEHFFQ